MAKTSEEVAAAKAEAAEASKRLKEMQVGPVLSGTSWHSCHPCLRAVRSEQGLPLALLPLCTLINAVRLLARCCAGPPLGVRRRDPVARSHAGEAGQEGGGLRVGDEEAGRQVRTKLTLLCCGVASMTDAWCGGVVPALCCTLNTPAMRSLISSTRQSRCTPGTRRTVCPAHSAST